MKRLACVLLIASGCTAGERAQSGMCPAGETCSPETPSGLYFIGQSFSNQLFTSGPAATAIGGTQTVALQYDRGDGVLIALNQPFTAQGGTSVAVDHTDGSQVIMRGAAQGNNYLRIADSNGLLMDRKSVAAEPIQSIRLVPSDVEMIPDGAAVVFAPGDRDITIELFGNGQRLVDDSMQFALTGASKKAWDELHVQGATVGTYPGSVVAGDRPPANVEFTVVDHADAIAKLANNPTAIAPNGSATLCFQATSTGSYIAGLTWSFSIDGTAVDPNQFIRNCVLVSTTKTTGSVTIAASAGGQAMTTSLPVSAMAREVARPAGDSLPSPLGDRAAL